MTNYIGDAVEVMSTMSEDQYGAVVTNGDHKRFYSQYVKTGAMGYTGWVIGMAYLTEKGMKKLGELNNVS